MADELHSPLARRLSQQLSSSPSPNPDGTPRLKRLSLIAARDGALGSPVRAPTPSRDDEDDGRASVDSLRTPIAASPSPRPRHGGRQSSISYAPSRGHAAHGSVSLRRERERAASPLEETEEKEGRMSTDTLTLGEKYVRLAEGADRRHSDLLRMIAMRERRVNELKQGECPQFRSRVVERGTWERVEGVLTGWACPAGRREAPSPRWSR